MRALSNRELLDVWERGRNVIPARRAFLLLGIASSDQPVPVLADTPVGLREERLLALRERLFGRRLEAIATCPACQERLEVSLDTGGLHLGGPVGGQPTVFELERDGYSLRFRLPTAGDLDDLAGDHDVASARLQLLKACVVSASYGGIAVTVAEVPEAVLGELGRRMMELDPRASPELVLQCAACGHQWTTIFDVASFLWTELDAWAERLLREVHVIARAHGWSETEILSLSPARRRAYLDLIES